jgi:hypothetical protein
LKWLIPILIFAYTPTQELGVTLSKPKFKEVSFIQQVSKTGCFSTCRKIVKTIGYDIVDSSDLIQLVVEKGNRLKTVSTDYSYLDSLLAQGLPAVVGVNHTLNYGYNEGTTEHYVVVVQKGFDSEGAYYRFLDVGKKDGADKTLKFRFSCDRLTYKRYTISQIRKLKKYGRTASGLQPAHGHR